MIDPMTIPDGSDATVGVRGGVPGTARMRQTRRGLSSRKKKLLPTRSPAGEKMSMEYVFDLKPVVFR